MTERGFFDAFPSLARLSQQKWEQVYAHFASAPGWLTEQLSIVEFPTDTIFIREGQPARDVYVVASGTVKAIEYRVLGVQYDFIGVDVDQAAITDPQYGEGMTVTSAMKGLGPTVENTLKDVIENDNWAAYSGKIASLGLVSAEPTENYVQLPMNSTHW